MMQTNSDLIPNFAHGRVGFCVDAGKTEVEKGTSTMLSAIDRGISEERLS